MKKYVIALAIMLMGNQAFAQMNYSPICFEEFINASDKIITVINKKAESNLDASSCEMTLKTGEKVVLNKDIQLESKVNLDRKTHSLYSAVIDNDLFLPVIRDKFPTWFTTAGSLYASSKQVNEYMPGIYYLFQIKEDGHDIMCGCEVEGVDSEGFADIECNFFLSGSKNFVQEAAKMKTPSCLEK